MKLKRILFVLATLLTGTLQAAMQRGDYPYTQELELLSGSDPTARFGSFTVNEELFKELNQQAGNLRIIDRSGTETPFLLRTKRGERTVTRERAIPFEKISFQQLPGNQIEIVMQNTEPRNLKTPLQSIGLVSDIQNFEKHVSIYSSDDQQSWQLIAERRPIFDYSRYIDIRNNRISFPPTAARYFKIEISNITEKKESPFTGLTRETRTGQEFSTVESTTFTRADFRINAINLYERITEVIKDKALKQPYSSSDFKITPRENTSQITFTTAQTPVTEITLLTETPYFYRRFKIETSSDGKSWHPVHSGIFSSVNTEASDEARSLQLPHPIRSANYRITIDNNDSPPLDINGVEIIGETREILFYCDQSNSYSVIYGAAEERTPLYDIGQVLAKTKSENTALYRAGPQKPNPGYSEKNSRGSLLSRRAVMTIAVLLMIAVLGWAIAKTARAVGAE